jgi:hypothetical protein
MANEITKINGVDKKVQNDDIIYYFPKALITVNTVNASYELRQTLNFSRPITILYADITDKLGSSDTEGYVDALATGGFFFEVASETETNTGTSLSSVDLTTKQSDIALNEIITQLKEIKFYIKAIAE